MSENDVTELLSATVGRLTGKAILISGATRGQGAAHAELLGREGARLLVADVRDEEGQGTVERLVAGGAEAMYVHLDVTQAGDWEAAVGKAERRFGQLDGLVNNAGITAYAPADTCSDREWETVLAVNQTGVFYGIRAAIPAFRRAGAGAIVNTSSIFGLNGAEDYFAYVASKAAVIGMTKSAALTYGGDRVRVNAIAPGVIETAMLHQEMADLGSKGIDALIADQPIARRGRAEDTSHAVLYLLSEESSFVTGTVITVDGGYSAR